MNWDKKSIVAVFVCTLLFMGYMTYLQKKYPDFYSGNKGETAEEQVAVPPPITNNPANTSLSAPAAAGTPAAAATIAPAQVAQLTPEQLTFETKTRLIRFDQNSGAIRSIRLKDYQHDQKSGDLVEMLDSPLVVQGTINTQDKTGRNGFVGKREGNTIRFARTENGWDIEQIFTIPEDGYGMQVKVNFKNTAATPQELNGGALIQENVAQPPPSGGFLGGMIGGESSRNATTFVYSANGKTQEKTVHDLCKDGAEATAFNLSGEKLDYIGIDRHYFLSFLWAKDQATNYLLERSAPANALYCPTSLMAWEKFGLVEGGGTVSIDLSGYFGPKQVDILEAHDKGLTHAIKLGWFSVFAHPLMLGLKELHKVLNNWGLAIIVITLLLKLLFFPLTRSAAISMKKMQKLQPQMTAIREKFKDDPQRQQKELMAFMGQNKVNPFKGCLPILPQIPVFIAFYNLLSQTIELRHAPFFGWIKDLASSDPYYITPVLLAVGMFLQQKLTPNPGMDKNQEKIMLMMPVIFGLMMLSMPAGMVLYMITNTIVSILQQQWLNKRLAVQLS